MSVVSPLQVAAVREGMSSIVPVPLLSLYTAKMVEMAVCGYEEVDIHMLKKVVRCVCARCASDFIENKTKLVSTFLSFLSAFLFHPPPLTLSSLPPPPLPLYPDIETYTLIAAAISLVVG